MSVAENGAVKQNVIRDKDTVPVLISSEKCTGCGLCLLRCSTGAISVSSGKAIVNPNLCMGIGGCIMICPDNAIGWDKRLLG